MTVWRRLDDVLETTKRAVLDTNAALDAAGVFHKDAALRQAAGQAFYNTSNFTLHDLRARASRFAPLGLVSLRGGLVPAFTSPATVSCERFDRSSPARRRLPASKKS